VAQQPLDTPEHGGLQPSVSAGTPKHEVTSWSAMPSVFAFLKAKLAQAVASA
jgi:hypothetical protein